jgi:hypothetical protein
MNINSKFNDTGKRIYSINDEDFDANTKDVDYRLISTTVDESITHDNDETPDKNAGLVKSNSQAKSVNSISPRLVSRIVASALIVLSKWSELINFRRRFSSASGVYGILGFWITRPIKCFLSAIIFQLNSKEGGS